MEAVYDYLGRPLAGGPPETLDSAPLFVLLPQGKTREMPLETPLEVSALRQGSPSAVVLQLQMPQSATDLDKQAHKVDLKDAVELDVFAYNFSDEAVTGTVSVEDAPEGWRLMLSQMKIEIEPMGRTRLPIRVGTANSGQRPSDGWFRLRGEFADAGRPVLAFRLEPK